MYLSIAKDYTNIQMEKLSSVSDDSLWIKIINCYLYYSILVSHKFLSPSSFFVLELLIKQTKQHTSKLCAQTQCVSSRRRLQVTRLKFVHTNVVIRLSAPLWKNICYYKLQILCSKLLAICMSFSSGQM
jgi:hypothetical protein